MLSPDEMTIVSQILVEDEGLEQFPYFDCCGKPWMKCQCTPKGKLTIGIGRNIDDVGISENEAMGLLINDIKRVTLEVERSFPWFSKINTPRRIVVISMTFNMGMSGFKQFKQMIKCLESNDFESAGNQMLNSKWATQVKSRAIRLAEIMKRGQF